MKTIVYVDGFNLYYGAVKKTTYKWLNIRQMCELHLPTDDIIGIKYFTAKIISRPEDPKQHIRQLVYLRALKTLPTFEIIYGHYSEHPKWMPLVNPPAKGSKYAEVIRTEEKGSDVNLAVHLVADAFRGKFELAVVVSNDSDLLLAVQIVQRELGLNVGILNPQIRGPQRHPSKVLMQEATFFRDLRPGILKTSQFPNTMRDAKGTFHKPKEWK